MKSFLIIDGNSILNRAFYGVNARMTSKIAGIHTNAIYGFLNIFWMIQEKIKSDYVAVCFDLSTPTFRHKMYEDYKGTRKGMPDELREQLPVMKEVLSALNIPVLELEGFEADDLLGTVSAINTKNGIFTYILTGDRDSFQLISKSTSVILPKSGMGKTEYSIYDNALLMENYGISPIQVIEVKALMGDSSDNIPGVKGVGEKTAYQLIQKYDNIDNIYKLLDEDKLDVTPKVKEKLSIGKDSAYMSKTLATIILDANINLDYEKCMVSDINKEATYEIFKRLEFKKFLDKFDFSDIDEEKINQNVMTNESKNYIEFKDASNTIIINNDNIDNFICNMENILNVENISYIYNNPNLSYFLVHLGILNEFLSIYINNTDTLYIIELGNIKNKDQKTYNKVIDLFLNSSANKIGYNIKQDIRYFFNFSNDIKRFNKDIMIDYYLLDATRQEYLLEYILNDIFGIMLEENKEDKKAVKQLSFFDSVEEKTPNFLSEMEISNISKATKAIFLASSHLLKKLEEEGMLRLYNEIEMPLVTTLASMEHTGMHVDKNKIKSFDIMISEKIEELTKEKTNNKPSTSGVIVKGIDNCLVKLSKCCNPVPGDEIVGYITKGRGVSVHRKDCKNVKDLVSEENRMIDVSWYTDKPSSYNVDVVVFSNDRDGLLADIIATITAEKTPIMAVSSKVSKERIVLTELTLEVSNIAQLNSVLKAIRKIDSVYEVRRNK